MAVVQGFRREESECQPLLKICTNLLRGREKAKIVCDCTRECLGFQKIFCIQIPCLLVYTLRIVYPIGPIAYPVWLLLSNPCLLHPIAARCHWKWGFLARWKMRH